METEQRQYETSGLTNVTHEMHQFFIKLDCEISPSLSFNAVFANLCKSQPLLSAWKELLCPDDIHFTGDLILSSSRRSLIRLKQFGKDTADRMNLKKREDLCT